MNGPPRASVALLMGAVAVTGANAMLLSPLTQLVGADLGVAPTEVLRANQSYGLATLLSALVFAPQIGRIGTDRALGAALLALAAGFVWIALAVDLPALQRAHVLAGLASGVALPAIYGLAAAIAPEGQTAKTMGRVLFGWTLLLIFGVAGAAFIAEIAGWRMSYAVFGALTLMLAVLSQRARLPHEKARPVNLLSVFRLKGFAVALGAISALMLGFYAAMTLIGTHVTVTLGRSTASAGLIPLVYGVGFGAAIVLDPLADRFGRARVAPALLALLSLTYVAMVLSAPSFGPLLAVIFLWGVFQHVTLTLAMDRLAQLSQTQRAAILGWSTAATYAAVFFGAVIGRALFTHVGFWAIAGVSMILAAALTAEALARHYSSNNSG
jgi:DHA1 family inner membrane transport protein